VNIEAMACGLPVVASRVGGIPEIIGQGQTGYLVPPGDHVSLADQIRRLRDKPSTRAAMSHSARSVALDKYSAQRRLPEHIAAYNVGERRHGPHAQHQV
jgi:glycosyltransferase involved in cell wall biosynthesis